MAAQVLAGKGFEQVYNLSGGIKAWQSQVAVGDPTEGLTLFSGEESVEATFMVAYGLEAGLREFYLSMAKAAPDPAVRRRFEDLAAIEVRHQEHLLATYSEMTGDRADAAAFEAAVAGHLEGGLSTADFLARFNIEVSSPVDVISMAMSIEAQALDLYQRATETFTGEDHRAVFQRIANEERAHLKSLGDLMDSVV